MRKSRGVTTYSGAHANTTRVRGKASTYACVSCDSPAKEWALRHDAAETVTKNDQSFSANPDDYQPMCFRCHRLYDKSEITHCPQGHEYQGSNVLMDAGKRKCRTCHYARARERRRAATVTPADRAKRNEYQRAYRARLKGDAA